MNRSLPVLAAALSPGCVVYAHDPPSDPGTVIVVEEPYNRAPYVLDAGAWVYWAPAYRDDVWAFEAFVDDPDGVGDVIGVWADVYDEYAGGQLAGSFELYPTSDPYVWYSEWFGSSTFLDPFWPGYTVDFVVYDAFEDYGWLTVWADTY